MPGGWAMAFWVALVYRGARAAGTREQEGSLLEQSQLRFPADFPDTSAGQAAQQASHELLEAKYNRIPPAKRPNYVKLGVATPFSFSWAQLVSEWTMLAKTRKQPEEESNVEGNVGEQVAEESGREKQMFCVCRCRKTLRLVQSLCQPMQHTAKKIIFCSDGRTSRPSAEPSNNIDQLQLDQVMSRSLVAVQVSFCQRGMPMCFAMICMPTDADLATRDLCDCTEPLHKPTTKKKSLSRKGKRKRATMANVHTQTKGESALNSDITTNSSQGASQGSSKYVCQEGHLVAGCTRQTIGYVTYGNFVFSIGHGQGVGFVALAGLSVLLQSQHKVASLHRRGTRVLVRSPQSLQYRWAYLSILHDF